MALSMDAAWDECKAALPVGWWIDRLQVEGTSVQFDNGTRDRYTWWEAWAEGPKRADACGIGPTPTFALQDLTARLNALRATLDGTREPAGEGKW